MLQFNHIDKKALETMFEKDLTKNLFQFQNKIIRHLISKKDKYVLLLNHYNSKTPIDGVDIISEMIDFDGNGSK